MNNIDKDIDEMQRIIEGNCIHCGHHEFYKIWQNVFCDECHMNCNGFKDEFYEI